MGDLALRSVPLRFAGVEAALRQAGLGGAHIWQAQRLPQTGRAPHKAAAEGLAPRSVERLGDECGSARKGSERTAERDEGVYSEGGLMNYAGTSAPRLC